MAKKRPSIRDKEVIKVVASKLLDDVIKWLEQSGETTDFENDEEERNRVVEDLVDAIESSINGDGYEIAKQLDHDGWSPDSDLVEVLDRTSSYLRSEVSRLSVVWFTEEGFAVIPNGTSVKSKKNHSGLGEIGKVIEFYPDGRYVVNFPQLGHKDPEDKKATGTSGFVIEHELLEQVP